MMVACWCLPGADHRHYGSDQPYNLPTLVIRRPMSKTEPVKLQENDYMARSACTRRRDLV